MSLSIGPYLDYVKTFLQNNPSKDLPYHNNEHILGVWDSTLFILENTEVADKDYLRLVLLFASLLHDYDHSGGTEDDSVNIERALIGLEQCVKECPLELPQGLLHDASVAIRSTEYPYTCLPANITERILRDADVLYAMLHHKPIKVLKGLRSEMEVRKGETITDEDLYVQQISFMESMEIHTEIGRLLVDQNKGRFLRELEKLIE